MATRNYIKPLPERSLELQAMRAEEEQRRQAQQAQQSGNQNAAASGGATPTAPAVQQTDNRTTQQLLDDSKKTYEDYLESDEYQQNILEANRRNQQQALLTALTTHTSISDMPLSAFNIVDNRERELNAVMEYYDTKLKNEQNQALINERLNSLSEWDEEDVRRLEDYVAFRGTDNLNLFSERSVLPTAAERAVAPLYQKYGYYTVEQIAEAMDWQQSRQTTEAAMATASEVGNNTNPLVGLAYSIPKQLGNISGTFGVMSELQHRTGQFSTLNPNNVGYLPSSFSSGVQEQIAQNIEGEEPTGMSRTNAMFYRGAVSAADNMTRMAMSFGNAGISAALAASGTFANSVQQYSAQGVSPTQALTMATVNTALEYGTEYLSDAEMLKFFENGTDGDFVKRFLWQTFGVEPTTEEINLFAGVAAEAAILGDKSDKNLQIGEMVANGMSYEEAQRQYMTGLWHEAAQTYAMTVISGGLQTAGTTAAGNLARRYLPQNTPTQAAPEAPMTPSVTESVTPSMTEEQQAQAAVEQTTQEFAQQMPTQEEAPRTEGQQMADNAIADTLNAMLPQESGTISNSTAEKILADPNALNQLLELTGAQIAGTKAEQRRAVKDAVAQLFSGNVQTEQQTAPNSVATVEANEINNAVSQSTNAVTNPINTYDNTEVNNNITGTGAAEANFSGKPAYNAILSEDNAQPDRRDDVRPMELPKQDINGGNVSGVTSNVYGSKITTEELASLMEEPLAKGDFSYATITNDQATQMAIETIAKGGNWESAYAQWAREVDRGVAGAEISARGALLLNHAAQQGNKDQWLEILADLRKLGTNTAQGLQAFRIIRTLTPPDKVEFMKMTVRKMVQDMKLGVDIEIDQALIDNFENAQTDEQRNEAMREIQKNVAEQIPSTILDKWTAIRYMNMLGNLKTNVRNIGGNIGSAIMYRMKDQVAATMELVLNKATNGKVQRTKANFVSKELLDVAKNDFTENVANVYSGNQKFNDNDVSGEFAQGVMKERRIFDSNLLEGYRKATNWMMNNDIFGDEAFGRGAYARALAGFLEANGVSAKQWQEMTSGKSAKTQNDKAILPAGTRVKAADRNNTGTIQSYNKADNTYLVHFENKEGQTASVNLKAELLTAVNKRGKIGKNIPKPTEGAKFVDYARSYALNESMEATFHDNSALANIASGAQKKLGVVGKGIMPFTKTPANVLTRAFEFSPLGIIDSTVKSIQATKEDSDISGTDIINSWAKTMTGTALFALGALMRYQGLLSGGPDEDEDKEAFEEMNGQQNYAFDLPNGKSYTMDWLTPVAMPMFMGAELWDIIEDGNVTFADLENVLTSIGDPMIQMSMLQSLNDSLDSIKYADSNLGQFVINAAVSYLTQGISNTLLGQIEKTTEENRTSTYVNKDSNVPQWLQRQLGRVSQKIPGWDYQQTDYLNAWGQTEENVGGLAYNLLSPGYLDQEQVDAITTELTRLGDVTGENVYPQTADRTVSYTDTDGNLHADYNLTQSEWETLQKTQGETSQEVVSALINSKDYQTLPDNLKAEAISLAYQYAKKVGLGEAIEGYPDLDGWMDNATKNPAQYIIQKAAGDAISGAYSDLTEALDNNWNTNQDEQALSYAYETFRQLGYKAQEQILDNASTSVGNFLEARRAGITQDEFIESLNLLENIEPLEGKEEPTQLQRVEAISTMEGLNPEQMELMLRQQVTDAQQKNMNELENLGFGVDVWLDVYRAIENESGTGEKKRVIAWIVDQYGINRATAEELYEIFEK